MVTRSGIAPMAALWYTLAAMTIPSSLSTTLCPYCARPVSTYGGRQACPHCARPIFSVSCPKCGRPTLNLTLIARYGKVTCFACHTPVQQLPDAPDTPMVVAAPPAKSPAPTQPALPTPPPLTEPLTHPTVTPRMPKIPIMPTAAEARVLVERCLAGLERMAQDREILRAPDLRAIITRFLDAMQDVLECDNAMESGGITDDWLRDPAHLDTIARLCYVPLWPDEGALLPPAVQAWVLAVDDAARRWQYARRRWLADTYDFTVMPTVPAITTVNPAWHNIDGDGAVIVAIVHLGFLLHGEVVRKAYVTA